jgi:hypothetical protein
VGVQMLLASLRWEKRLLRFPELSGAGRTLENGADEEETRAKRMDGWKAGLCSGCFRDRDGEGTARRLESFLFPPFRLLRGTHTPSFAHSAPMRAEDFLVYTEKARTEGIS